MATIYEITDKYQRLMELADDPEVSEEAFFEAWEEVDEDFEAKAESSARVMKNLEAEADGLKAEIDRLTGHNQTKLNSIARIKATLQRAMEITEKPKFKTKLFSFGIQNNPPSCFIPDEARVPQDFRIPQPDKIDKRGIIAFLKGLGEDDKCDWAELTQSKSLRIR